MFRLLLTSLLICSVYSKQDIYDLLGSLGCKTFANLLQGTGYMYTLGDDHSGNATHVNTFINYCQKQLDMCSKYFKDKTAEFY